MLGAAVLSIAIATQEWGVPNTPKIDVMLLASHKTVMPGDRFAVLIDMEISDPWHVYWKNPGDSGIPTRVEWRLPSGWKASEIEYLAPHRITAGDLISYGYEGEMKMLSWISVPENARVGSDIQIGAKVSWLACIEQCVPGDAEVSAQITLGRSPGADMAGMEALSDFRDHSPKPAPTGLLKVFPNGDNFSLVINEVGIESPFFFADSFNDISPGSDQQVITQGSSVEMRLVKSPYSQETIRRLKGVLTYTDRNGKRQAFAVNLPVSLNTRDGEEQ